MCVLRSYLHHGLHRLDVSVSLTVCAGACCGGAAHLPVIASMRGWAYTAAAGRQARRSRAAAYSRRQIRNISSRKLTATTGMTYLAYQTISAHTQRQDRGGSGSRAASSSRSEAEAMVSKTAEAVGALCGYQPPASLAPRLLPPCCARAPPQPPRPPGLAGVPHSPRDTTPVFLFFACVSWLMHSNVRKESCCQCRQKRHDL